MTPDSIKVDVISGISSMAMRQVLTELADVYERQSQQKVSIVSTGGVAAAQRVADGEAFDFVVLAVQAIEKLGVVGRIDLTTLTDLARSGVAVAVRAGAPRPDIGSEAAIREVVLRARSIGYSTGPSGDHVVRLFERWGVADVIASRLVRASPGVPVGTLVASGNVELCFQQLSELIDLPGVDVVGPLPSDIQLVTVFSAAVCVASRNRAATHALLAFLASTAGDTVKRRHGMEPAPDNTPADR
jgi:molybdate transport system substrate-binding protein